MLDRLCAMDFDRFSNFRMEDLASLDDDTFYLMAVYVLWPRYHGEYMRAIIGYLLLYTFPTKLGFEVHEFFSNWENRVHVRLLEGVLLGS